MNRRVGRKAGRHGTQAPSVWLQSRAQIGWPVVVAGQSSSAAGCCGSSLLVIVVARRSSIVMREASRLLLLLGGRNAADQRDECGSDDAIARVAEDSSSRHVQPLHIATSCAPLAVKST